jgi:tight adherence protein B
MINNELFLLFGVALVLLVVCGVFLVMLMKSLDREKRFKDRVIEAIDPGSRPIVNPLDEQVSLTKQVSNMDMLKSRAASLIGVDLEQSATYPMPWFLVPPLALVISSGMAWLISKTALCFHHPQLAQILVPPVGGLFLMKWIFNKFVSGRNAKLLSQFPDALSTVVRCVRVGIPMGEALRSVSRDALEPTKTEFSILADKVQIGIPLDVALRELSARINMTEYKFFATALTLQARSGGGITQTLETLAEVIRKRVGLKARGYALTAEARTSAYLLSALPFVAGGAIYLEQRQYIMLLFLTPSGQGCLGLAIVLMIMGIGTIQFMIASVLK